MDNDNKDMEESIRTMVNMIRYMCCTFFKMPASRDVKFVIKNTKSRWLERTRTWTSQSGLWWTCIIICVAECLRYYQAQVQVRSGPGQVKVSQGPVKVWSGPGLVQVRSRSSNHYCMICNHVPFISAFKMTVHHCGLPAVPILVLDRASRFFYGSPLWWTCRSPFWLTSS